MRYSAPRIPNLADRAREDYLDRMPGSRWGPLALALITSTATGLAQEADSSSKPPAPAVIEQRDPLRVGYSGSAPFIVDTDRGPTGISIEVWREVALRADLDFKLVRREGVSQLLDGLERGDLDVAVGPISITAARARRVDFTQPYYQAPLTILAREKTGGPWARLTPFLSGAFVTGLSVLLGVLLLVGVLVWLAERRHNPNHFPPQPARGIGNGLWFALVTMTTVGYGDRAPVTVAGRLVAGVWMVIALLTASSLTAGIATALTLSQLDPLVVERAEDLSGRRVAVVRSTPGARFAKEHGGRLLRVNDLDAAVTLLAEGRVDAVVFDRPALEYQLTKDANLDARLSPRSYEPLGYGFALPRRSKLRHDLNVALLETTESGSLAATTRHWLSGHTE